MDYCEILYNYRQWQLAVGLPRKPPAAHCLVDKLCNALNTNSSHSLIRSSQPPNLRIFITSSLFNLLATLAPHITLPSLDHQHIILLTHNLSLLQVHASPCLWNQLPSSVRQPHSSPSVSDLPVHAPAASSYSLNSPLSPSITLSLSLPAQDLPFPQIFPTIDSLPASGLTPRLYDWSVSSERLGF